LSWLYLYIGISTNDIIDRNGQPIVLESTEANLEYLPFGNAWRNYDDATDTDPK
jgi:hypothetical protein